MDWHEGYVSDIDYLTEFFPEQSPSFLSFACILNGVEPVALDRKFTYFELGSGQGFTANLLAASNPHGKFYACDFNPAHIAASRQLAASAQLENITFLENSFADLAAGQVDLPKFDFITLHGVYSWVNINNRRHIIHFIDQYLKPGGIVFISYNAMPGWSIGLPLQRLILEHANLYPASRHQQIENMRELVSGMMENGATYFTSNDSLSLKNYIGTVMEGDASWSSYLAHEYMNCGWDPLYHADVARDVANAKLDYAGSAYLSQAFPQLHLTEEQRQLLEDIGDPVLRETLADYIKNTCFRKDIYVRGARRMSQKSQEQWLRKTGFALTVLRDKVNVDEIFPFQIRKFPESVYHDFINALGTGPKTLMELVTLSSLKNKSLLEIAEMASLLIEADQASAYFLCSAGQDSTSSLRLNHAIAKQASIDSHYRFLASPLLGSGVKAPLFQRLVYRALSLEILSDAGISDIVKNICQKMPLCNPDVARIVAHVWQALPMQYYESSPNERILESDTEKMTQGIFPTVEAILTHRRPIWDGLRMLPGEIFKSPFIN